MRVAAILILTLMAGCRGPVQTPNANTDADTVTTQISDSALTPDRDEFDDLFGLPPDNPHRPRLNGKRLDLDGVVPSDDGSAWGKAVPLPDGDFLLLEGDLLARFASDGEPRWSYRESQTMLDTCFIDATGLVYGTAGDNTMFILDPDSGRVMHRESRNGRAAYGEVIALGDLCLVLDRFRGYRDDVADFEADPNKVPTSADWIVAWRGTQEVWRIAIPPDADVTIAAGRILAITRTDKAVYYKSLDIPGW